MPKKTKKEIEKAMFEDARLELALLKRHHAYRASFEKLKRNFQIEDGLLSGDCEDILFHEMGFSIWAAPELSKAACDGTLLKILDPYKDVGSAYTDVLLYFMFYFDGFKEIKRPDLQLHYRCTLENFPIDPKDLEDYERLLKIDLRKPKEFLVKELKNFIDNIYTSRKIALGNIKADSIKNRSAEPPALPEELVKSWNAYKKRELKSFESWEPDTSRSRKEAWMQIKVWDLYGTELPPPPKETSHPWGFSNSDRKRKRGFEHIAGELKITVNAARHAYYRAFERIYDKSYNRKAMRRVLSEIKQSVIDQAGTCENCPNFNTCTDLCPKMLAVVNQDEVPKVRRCITEIATPEDCKDPIGWLNAKNRK